MNRRNTKQKQIILKELQSRYDHPTADEIYEAVKKKHENISRGTVYRNLGVLSEEHQIKNISLPQINHFDGRTENHYHFVCDKCGKVFDIDIEYDSSFDNKKLKSGFFIKTHETFFRGICPDCLNKSNSIMEEKV